MRTLVLVVVLSICGCADQGSSSQPLDGVVVVGVLPDQSPEGLRARFGELIEHLKAETGLEIVLMIPSDYDDMLNRFAAGRMHLGNFGAVTYLQAEQRSGAVPLVMRDVDLQFTSCYLIGSDEPRSSVAEFEGGRLAFGPELSTSGHLMPRHFMNIDAINPETFFSELRHADAHDQTAEWVRDGVVDIGVANCNIINAMFADGRLSDSDVRVLETTPPFANYVWAMQPSLDRALVISLRDAFLALDANIESHAEMLKALGAGGYLPASRDDLDDVRNAIESAGLLATEGAR
ncbi:MAG: phosphate/phosphite/phosphonate ABC transporter substrate-binding protein [Gammaproteobacteria bacterium]|nr:phosphate/phosphite/phosphonate ABC transporter substrate-binding protein [Gammaproteobacteria bacterium]